MSLFIYPYNMGSNSIKSLKQKLGAKVIKLEGSNFKGKADKIVINWGNSTMNKELAECIVVNHPDAVKQATNKLTLFNLLTKFKLNIPEFTTDKKVAKTWSEDGKIVVVREKLTGHSAEGLVLIENIAQFEDYNHKNAKMYVQYIPKKDEYRIHVFQGQVFDEQRKALREDFPKGSANWKVRNHSNGFIFARKGFQTPKDVREQAVKAVALTGLDFGAVDVIWNNHRGKAYVLEINTAPGLEGTTLEKYSESLSEVKEQNIELERKKIMYKAYQNLVEEGVIQENPYKDFGKEPGPKPKKKKAAVQPFVILDEASDIKFGDEF